MRLLRDALMAVAAASVSATAELLRRAELRAFHRRQATYAAQSLGR